jgi:hypothetical protein
MAVFAAEIRKLDDGANENSAAEIIPGNGCGSLVKRALLAVPRQ